MSTRDPSTRRLPPGVSGIRTLLSGVVTAIRGLAFWATILLPLVVLAMLISGTVTAAPAMVVGLVLMNVCCVALGHSYNQPR